MKNNNLIKILLSLSMVFSMVCLVEAKATESIVINGNIFIKHTADELIEIIEEDSNIYSDDKIELINKINTLQSMRITYDYWTIYSTCVVNSSYTCRPYFYTYSSFGNGGYPNSIEEILYANIDRNYNGTSKQFGGDLYYNLEASNCLFWDLNGDFYNNGNTTFNLGVSVEVGEAAKTTFTASMAYSSNHFAYCHKDGRVKF
ncbi:MAG: hypothetical protein U0L85_11665 [Bacilli bacterium]|nr:hypothetical protein [Bacilli bacterium]